jgi:hypothetical protein
MQDDAADFDDRPAGPAASFSSWLMMEFNSRELLK